MGVAKRLLTICLVLLVLMTNAAMAEIPFLVYSNGWTWDDVPVDVMLKASVSTHMPFDDERLAMLTPITDMLSLRLVTGENEGLVTVAAMEEELLTMHYKDNAVQLSSMPGIVYSAKADPMSEILGEDVSHEGLYEILGLKREGETLLTDGRVLLERIPNALEKQGKRSKNTTSISGYGRAAYLMEYIFTANKAAELQTTLVEICPDGWLKEIIRGLSFSGKQSIRMHFTQDDVLLRMEYNGSCGPANDSRTVKLIYKLRHDQEIEKDYIELTSPAKKGKNKNNLSFDRTVQTNKHGSRVINGSFKYTTTAAGLTSVWSSEFALTNAYTDKADILSGKFTLEKKLNGAEKVSAITFEPNLAIACTEDSPKITGSMTITEMFAGRITEKAEVSVDLKRAEPLNWTDAEQQIDLSEMNEAELAGVQSKVAVSLAESLVRPLILKLGKDAQWFFRDLSDEVIQSILDAAASR